MTKSKVEWVEIGGARLACGDCLEVMKEIDHADMILCDLPSGTTACKWDSVIPFQPLWEQYKRIIKSNGVIALTGCQQFTSALIMSNVKMFKYSWLWIKSQAVGHLNAYKMPMKNVEDICIFYIPPVYYNPQIRDKNPHNIRPETTLRKSTSCYGQHSKESKRKIPLGKTLPVQTLHFNNSQNNYHPTEKPLPLMEYLISTYTKQGDIVMDNCMGSGTTGVAAMQTGRKFIGIESDPQYFDIAYQRMSSQTEKTTSTKV